MDTKDLKDIQNEVLKKSKIIDTVIFIIWVIIMFLLYKKGINLQAFFFITVFIMAIRMFIKYIFLNKQITEFNNGFKNKYVLSSLNKIFTDLKYFPDKGLDYGVIANTRMMDMGDRYSSNDYFEGKYKNVNVKQADVHIEEEQQTTDSDGHTTTTWVTIFEGKWMIFDFNKTFTANVQVSQKGFGNSRVNNWGEKNKYKKVEMEDAEFNKMFRIYAQNEHDAFYILTPSLMEKIKNLARTVSGKLLLCFINNELHIGLYNYKDSFEHSVYKKIDEEKINDDISKEIKIITNFVDELDLDNSLFRREV
ncbi:MAG: DUF3137 domain-containing protein [Tenericutes bacterium]|nr:DUF3137 domain-containing protein [Mycoplasmatota bacterium]